MFKKFIIAVVILFFFFAYPAVAASAPTITSINPNPVPAINASQWITINGSGFVLGLKTILRTGNEIYTIINTSNGFVSSNQIKIYPNFTDVPAQWTVQVVNPDGQQSSRFSFNVGTTVVPVPSTPTPPPSARISDYSVSPRNAKRGESATLLMLVTNTGSSAATFYAAASLRRPDNSMVDLPLAPLSLSAGQHGNASWSYTFNTEGGWDVVFGIWQESGKANSLGNTGWLNDYVNVSTPPPTQTLVVSILVNPLNGTAPLNNVSVKASVFGTAQGTVNYTFYCNRSDSGTNIMSDWNAKFDGIPDKSKTAVCNYPNPGTYTIKVIAEQDSAPPAEVRVPINVALSQPPAPTPTPPSTPPPTPVPTPSARISDYSVSPRNAKRGESATLLMLVTNTGFSAATFYAAASLRRPDNSMVDLPLAPISLSAGQHGNASWSYTFNTEGGWDVVFGIWQESGKANSLGNTGWLNDYVNVSTPTPTPTPTPVPTPQPKSQWYVGIEMDHKNYEAGPYQTRRDAQNYIDAIINSRIYENYGPRLDSYENSRGFPAPPVTPTPVVPKPTAKISAHPSRIPYGSSVTIEWTSANATSCTISPTGWSGLSDSRIETLTASKTYTLNCSGQGGSTSDSLTVMVEPQTVTPLPADLVIENFTIDKQSVNAGDTVKIQFIVRNRGGTPSQAFLARGMLSSDNNNLASGKELFSNSNFPSISPDGGYSGFFNNNYITLSIPINTQTGAYYIGVLADNGLQKSLPLSVTGMAKSPGAFILNYDPPRCYNNAPAVRLSWDNSNGADSYTVYRNGSFYANTGTDRFFDNNANVVAGQTYTYYVQAKNSSGPANSNQVTVNLPLPSNICVPVIPVPPSAGSLTLLQEVDMGKNLKNGTIKYRGYKELDINQYQTAQAVWVKLIDIADKIEKIQKGRTSSSWRDFGGWQLSIMDMGDDGKSHPTNSFIGGIIILDYRFAKLSEDQIAFILGHEIYHAINNLPNMRVTLGGHIEVEIQSMWMVGGCAIGNIVTPVAGCVPGAKAGEIVAKTITALFKKWIGYIDEPSREKERMADNFGMRYLSMAGFNLEGALDYLKNRASGEWKIIGYWNDFFSAYPSYQSRLEEALSSSPILSSATLTPQQEVEIGKKLKDDYIKTRRYKELDINQFQRAKNVWQMLIDIADKEELREANSTWGESKKDRIYSLKESGGWQLSIVDMGDSGKAHPTDSFMGGIIILDKKYAELPKDQIAFILAHEISHVIKKEFKFTHNPGKIPQSLKIIGCLAGGTAGVVSSGLAGTITTGIGGVLLITPSAVAGCELGSNIVEATGLIGKGIGYVWAEQFNNKLLRDNERFADNYGMIILLKAGFDLEEAIDYLKNRASGEWNIVGYWNDFFSAYSSDQSRFEEALKHLTELNKQTAKVLGKKIVNREDQIGIINSDAAYITSAPASEVASAVNEKRDLNLESQTNNHYVSFLTKGKGGIVEEVKFALNNFISYGTVTTESLGAGERAGVVNSFQSAFGNLPESTEEWQDVIKIANGRWPTQRNSAAETKAKASFKKIYGKEANMGNQNDNAAITIIAYGLRPSQRNLDSEKAAILSFKYFYKRAPVSAIDWDTVRAIAYSGAER